MLPAHLELIPVTTGRTLQIHADGVSVHAVEWRPERARRQVLLVHGLGANTISWEPSAQRLADRLDAVVTAVDLVGFGRTRAPERTATLATNERLVGALLEQRGPSIVMGNSMGGAIGVRITARRPELVERLVLVNPAVPHPRPGVGDWVRLARLAPMMVPTVGRTVLATRARLLGPERLVDSTLSWCLDDPKCLDPDVRLRLIELAAERYAYPEAPAAYAEAARSMLVYLARGILDDLAVAASARPTMIVHGARDRLVPLAAAVRAAARHEAIELCVLDDIGHTPQLEDPERFVSVVADWVGTLPAADAAVGGVRS